MQHQNILLRRQSKLSVPMFTKFRQHSESLISISCGHLVAVCSLQIKITSTKTTYSYNIQ